MANFEVEVEVLLLSAAVQRKVYGGCDSVVYIVYIF